MECFYTAASATITTITLNSNICCFFYYLFTFTFVTTNTLIASTIMKTMTTVMTTKNNIHTIVIYSNLSNILQQVALNKSRLLLKIQK